MTSDYRVLVTASRDLKDRLLVEEHLEISLTIALARDRRLVVVHGHCGKGGDEFADQWGWAKKQAGFPVDVERHPAQNHPTQNFGPWPYAGPERNAFMVSRGADECHAYIDQCTSWKCRRIDPHGSHGATGCADLAEKAGIHVERFELWKAS
jgi:hypothetical protein